MKEVSGVILVSPNGRDNWKPVMPDDVPAWVREPDNMKKLIEGFMCFKGRAVQAPGIEEASEYYRLEVLEETPDVKAMRAAAEKRERKSRIRLAY